MPWVPVGRAGHTGGNSVRHVQQGFWIQKKIILPFSLPLGEGQGGWEQMQLDVAACHLPYWETSSNLMPGCPTCCWVHLAGVLGVEKMYLKSGIIIKIYPTLSVAIGEWNRVDESSCIWMWLAATFLFGKHQSIWFFRGEIDSIGLFLLNSSCSWMY